MEENENFLKDEPELGKKGFSGNLKFWRKKVLTNLKSLIQPIKWLFFMM